MRYVPKTANCLEPSAANLARCKVTEDAAHPKAAIYPNYAKIYKTLT